MSVQCSDQCLNLNSLTSFDKDFTPAICERKEVWTSPDPRLQSSAHNGTRLVLDSPPLNGKLSQNEVYQPRTGYNMRYPNYTAIKGGQITYYIDPKLAKPFLHQLFTGPMAMVMDEYRDPMGTYKPHYCLEQLKSGESCPNLSWIQDSQYHRQDLMARQLWKRNQTDYQTRFIAGTW
jgi:hypothetical protein